MRERNAPLGVTKTSPSADVRLQNFSESLHSCVFTPPPKEPIHRPYIESIPVVGVASRPVATSTPKGSIARRIFSKIQNGKKIMRG
ncbi:hypothetical protein Pla52o_01630 [Novipirellula galeiformis]|uniref:Uncharacterized protein n=1 Tax=Novipirellula galeiformis TaxID=2528004 RepID=A0A5C6CP46_9BACT|nr:hypothetical protein Pla52o_01630 [Novipirellula galeiformis]